ncbi:hypothetical protein ACYATO_09170 [Lactobacillaceae bacterium Melli_B3]
MIIKLKFKYIINGIIDFIILIGIIITLTATDGEYLEGIITLIIVYIVMIIITSLAQHHNHNGIFSNNNVNLSKGILFNLFFLFTKAI